MDYILLILLILGTVFSHNFLIPKTFFTSFCILIFAFWYICNMFTGNGVTDAVFYHLFSGIKGASLADSKYEIAMSVLFIIILISFCYFTYKKRNDKRWSAKSKLSDFIFAVTSILFVTQSASAVNVINSLKILSNGNGSVVAPLYKKPVIDSSLKYNYIFIYAESLERTFRNLNGKNYIPNISLIADKNLEFTDIQQISGTGWTMAGIVNTQCGVPLVLPQGNSASNISNFLPAASCIVSEFKNKNYETLFIRGSDKEFAGGDKFLSQHGWGEVQDKNYFEQNNISKPEDISGWGVHDDVLLTHAYSEFIRLSQNKKNFLLSFLTVNTHSPSGKFLSQCEGHIDAEITNEMLKSVACSDYLLSEFIKKVQVSDYYKNTVIVLVSDHLMMENTASDLLNKVPEDRKNNFIIIKKDLTPQKINKQGSLMDVWPTVLDISGIKESNLGFGRSLLSGKPSPMIDATNKDREVSDFLSFASHLWSFPSINSPMFFNQGSISIGGQEFKTPMLATVDANNNINGVFFESIASSIVKNSAQGKTMLFIDACKFVSDTQSKNGCAYILSRDQTEKLKISKDGIVNKKTYKASPVYHEGFLGFSSAPYYIPTENNIPVNNGFTPVGVSFYNYDRTTPSNTKYASFDTCNGPGVSIEKVNELSENGKHPLIFSSNDSLVCVHPIDSFLQATKIDSTLKIGFRTQITGVISNGKVNYIIGEPDKPLDVFVDTNDYSIYKICGILNDC